MTPHAPRMLLVEDDPHIRRLLVASLRRSVWDVDEAANGERALELLAGDPYDAILLDLVLPQLGGFRICQHIRELDGERPYIIMMTADDSEETREMARDCGVDEFLPKPFQIDELLKCLAPVVARVMHR
ncbi:MAG: PleD family two-component system response regulator [Thermoanaerobaculia bacterium]